MKSVSEEQKISTRGPKKVDDANLGLDSGGPQAPGERKREGSEALRCRRYRKKLGQSRNLQELDALVSHARPRWGGGLKPPGGDHRRPPFLALAIVIEQTFVVALLAFAFRKC